MVTREELYELVWSEPMTQIAEKLEVSGSYMIRVCNALRVPRPGRGYWARVAAGQKMKKEPLPAARPGDQLTWSKGDELDSFQEASAPEAAPSGKRTKPILPEIHRVLNGAKAELLHGYPTDDDGYLKPYKQLRADITTSKASLDKALTLANDLFNTFEKAGYRVAIGSPSAPDHRPTFDEREVMGKNRGPHHESRLRSPSRPTLAYIGDIPIGLAVIEMTEEVVLRYVNGDFIRETDYVPPKRARGHDYTWTTTRELPSGRFRVIAFAPHPNADWSLNWQETKANPLSSQLSAIVKAVKAGLPDLTRKVEAAQRQAKIEHQRWLEMMERHRREENQRRIAQSYKDSKDHLARIMTEWTAASDVERFFAGVERRAAGLPDEERMAVAERLKLAREFLGLQDPLDILLEWKTPAERYKPIYDPNGGQIGAEGTETD